MEMFVKCDRCGALVWTTSETFGGAPAQCAPCVVASDRGGSEYTVLCPDCMSKLKSWLEGVSEEPQDASDSAERLAADLVRAFKNSTASVFCRQQLACGYFGHGGDFNCYGDECPAYGNDLQCSENMFDDVRRRCEAMGIDIAGDGDE